MLKKWTLGMILLTTSSFSQATLITKNITGSDMDGMKVKVCFDVDANNDSKNDCKSKTWNTISINDNLGGAVKNNWFSLTLAGNSFPDYDPVEQFQHGLWVLENLSSDYMITSFRINAFKGDIWFDKVYGDIDAGIVDEQTPGTGAGWPFMAFNADMSDNTSASASFSKKHSPDYNDLYGRLKVNFDSNNGIAALDKMNFSVDTDKVEVPEPATMFTFALGLIALISLRKKSSGK